MVSKFRRLAGFSFLTLTINSEPDMHDRSDDLGRDAATGVEGDVERLS